MGDSAGSGFQQLLVIHPRTLADAERVIAAVQEHQAVLLNTSQAAGGEAQRVIDFICGGMEGLDAQVHRIGAEVFLCSPGHGLVVDDAALATEQRQRAGKAIPIGVGRRGTPLAAEDFP